jgi:transcriptional regulator with XRE-family HTH domain
MPKTLNSPRQRRLRGLLRDERRRAGLTQQQVADRLRRPQSFVAKYEQGERRLDVVEFLDVAKAIGFDPESVLRQLARGVGQ